MVNPVLVAFSPQRVKKHHMIRLLVSVSTSYSGVYYFKRAITTRANTAAPPWSTYCSRHCGFNPIIYGLLRRLRFPFVESERRLLAKEVDESTGCRSDGPSLDAITSVR